jgi:ribonuclease R
MPRPKPKADLPSLAELRRFLGTLPRPMSTKALLRAFAVSPADRARFQEMLRHLASADEAETSETKPLSVRPEPLPRIAVVEITAIDRFGRALARPFPWDRPGPPPRIALLPARRAALPLLPGARLKVRLLPRGPGRYAAEPLELLAAAERGFILGVIRPAAWHPERRAGKLIVPIDRRLREEWRVVSEDESEVTEGDVVRAEPLPSPPGLLPLARIRERLGREGDGRLASLLSLLEAEIPVAFPEAALAEADRLGPAPLAGREDLRDLPLVTIDGPDARDFDDAVFAERLGGEEFRLIVAIADVAHYVPPGSALDRAARERGTSVYFPDRVVPMLPEALSAHWCSLKPGEERPCLFVEMRIDAKGRKRHHRFGRGLMKSRARLTYEEVEADAVDGRLAPLLADLRAAHAALATARLERGALDIDLPEYEVRLEEDGTVRALTPRPRLTSHRLIEEFMIAANVAAAEELERRGGGLFRIHDAPAEDKLIPLRATLERLGLALPARHRLTARDFAALLARAAERPEFPLLQELILRAQAHAAYAPDNIGHFGLALPRYAHFTSPIRRYADLVVHRALIAGLGLPGEGGHIESPSALEALGLSLSALERRAESAERRAKDRYMAAYLASRLGEEFDARISGVTRGAVFVSLEGLGASGLLPLSALPPDRWVFDPRTQSLSGQRSGAHLELMTPLRVRLIEANPLNGDLLFHPAPPRPRPSARLSPEPRKHEKSGKEKEKRPAKAKRPVKAAEEDAPAPPRRRGRRERRQG